MQKLLVVAFFAVAACVAEPKANHESHRRSFGFGVTGGTRPAQVGGYGTKRSADGEPNIASLADHEYDSFDVETPAIALGGHDHSDHGGGYANSRRGRYIY
ncbi:hypothetical protein TCAL_06200 [Tigriopus californicus]|uniref:Attacin C-terminal domain-containing protein n=2 Tax=Tigriopus californicus TaxID=6832 RepID=A0A553NSM5_TIGCA|nr:hypothetical protein TCAL_06200 [Tigriopus californicus]|eukprot:TCALIF_06200-PA protein Name:"Protein of unknown function" AED:0.15 eAED:0.15 QI:79/1/0.5/1/1/1/2/0/100